MLSTSFRMSCCRRSRMFIPQAHKSIKPSKELLSKSHRLLMDNGIVEPVGRGFVQFLPLGMRSLDKLCLLIEKVLNRNHCQKIQLPSLCDASLWKRSGRFEQTNREIFTLTDRTSAQLLLSPTHEEVVTQLVAKQPPMSCHQFPLKLYQTSFKFRDEMNPRFGLLRAREFLMTDLYVFDVSPSATSESYAAITRAYEQIFLGALRLPTMKVLANSGNMGGSLSHEFHLPAACGQDIIRFCSTCKTGVNEDVPTVGSDNCPQCNGPMEKIRTLEVAHSFVLGQKYSAPLEAKFLDATGTRQTLEMSCYGIGTTRLLAAAVELLSSEKFIRWPERIAPFTVAVIPPKTGSKEDLSGGTTFTEDFAHRLQAEFPCLHGDVMIDDRPATVGRRLDDSQRLGVPNIFVGAKSAMEPVPKLEFHNYDSPAPLLLTLADAIQLMRDRMSSRPKNSCDIGLITLSKQLC